jgi:succinate-acetate transporter protein
VLFFYLSDRPSTLQVDNLFTLISVHNPRGSSVVLTLGYILGVIATIETFFVGYAFVKYEQEPVALLSRDRK